MPSAIASAWRRASCTTRCVRLDRTIGTLIDSLYKLRDSTSIVFALTADHAVTLPPELAKAEPGAPPPMRVDLNDLAKTFRGAIAARGADSSAFDFEDAMLFVDKASLEQKGIKIDSLARAFADAAKREPGVIGPICFKQFSRPTRPTRSSVAGGTPCRPTIPCSSW